MTEEQIDFQINSGHSVVIACQWKEGTVFDCGHPPPRTEIHPPSSMAFTRIQPVIFKSVGNDPLLASHTSIFINGAGGVFTPNLKRLINPDTSLLNLKTRELHLELCQIFTLGMKCPDKDFVAAAL